MIVIVARKAGIVQAQEGPLALPNFTITDVLGLVTLPAVNNIMLPFQLITCERMVKVVFIKTGSVKITAMVVAVADKTILAAHLAAGVIAPILIHQRLDFLMASQAFGIGNLVAQIMTLSTITHAFQISVPLN